MRTLMLLTPDTHANTIPMASPTGSSQRKGVDEWTMVDEVSELMDIEGMSDISLPPLPPFETGSQHDASEEDEQGGHDPSRHQRHAAVAEDVAEFSGDGSDSSIGVGGGVEKPVGGKKRSASVRRRESARYRGRSIRAARAASMTDAAAEKSSPSVSPPRPRRRAGRMKRNGRRMDEGSPRFQAASEASDDDYSSSSLDFSSSSRSPALRTLGESGGRLVIARGASPPGARNNSSSSCIGQGLEFEDNEAQEGRGRGGSALVPFSLEEITCIASETVSATSSPFGIHQGTRLRTLSRGSSRDAAAMPTAAGASAAATSSSGVRTCGGVPLAVGGEEELTPSAASRGSMGNDSKSSEPFHHESFSTASQLSYATGFSTSANSARVTGGGVARGVNASDLCAGGADGGAGGVVTAARTDLAAGGVIAGNVRDILRTESTGSGVWSLSARGMTPLGRLFGGGVERGVGSVGGGVSPSVSASRGVNGSLVGFSTGYRTAVLEARAEAAEEQGDFWQRRAGAAEDANRKLRKLISAQAQRIVELASEKHSGGVEECKDIPPCDGDEELKQFGDPLPTIGPRTGPSTSDVGSREGDIIHANELKEQEEREELVESWRDARSSEHEEKDEEAAQENDGEGVGVPGGIGGIAFTSFSIGDVVMFFPTPEGNFLAFNVGCPGHFLSKECQELIGRDEHFRPYYVLGRIIEIQDVTCGEDNPYKLSVGQEIKTVSVETITPDLKAARIQ